MKHERHIVTLLLIVSLGLAGLAFAQEEPPKPPAEPEKAPEAAAPAKEEPKPEAAAAPAAAATPAAAPAAAAAPKSAAPPALSASAKAFEPLALSYKKASDDMQSWIETINKQMSASDEKIAKLQAQISANDAAATQAKVAGDDKKAKSLTSDNKKLKDELDDAVKSVATARSNYVKQAGDKVKQIGDAANAALGQLKK